MRVAVEITCFSHGHNDNALSILDKVRDVPSAAVSFLVKLGCAISRAYVKMVRNIAILPGSPSVYVWFITLNLPFSGSQKLEAANIIQKPSG